MAIKASSQITLSCVVDVDAVTRYYLLQSSTLATPGVPTTNPPKGWTNTEPTYEEGSTSSLYTVELVEFSDGTWNYSNVSLSSSYEAAKIAYNKALNAEKGIVNDCSIIATSDSFIQLGENYTPDNITLSPVLNNCMFDMWYLSTDMGNHYQMIIPSDTALADDNSLVETDVEGISFNPSTNELVIANNASCFVSSTVVFMLDTDYEGVYDTITIVKHSDFADDVENLVTELEVLREEYNSLSLTLDSVNNTITSKVEENVTLTNEELEKINQQLSEVIQKADSIQTNFTSLEKLVTENGEELTTLTTYIRESADGIEVGKLEDNIKTLMASSYFAILFNNEIAMKLEQTLLTIQNVKAMTGFQLGHTVFTTTDYGYYEAWIEEV